MSRGRPGVIFKSVEFPPETNCVATCGERHIIRAGAGLLTARAKVCRSEFAERTSTKHCLVRETARGLIDDEAAPLSSGWFSVASCSAWHHGPSIAGETSLSTLE